MGKLHFEAKEFNQNPLSEVDRLRTLREAEIVRKQLLLIEKKAAWERIVIEANDSFQDIEATIERKCFACHDANTKTPIYGRILRSRNPVYQHQRDGLLALDFSKKFPFVAKGNPPQLSLLKAIKNEVMDRSMPIKAYTTFFRNKKITDSDEERILAWVDPLIDQIQAFDERFQESDLTLDQQVNKIFEAKCFRCHANGNDRGGFGDMQDRQLLLKSRYLDLKNPFQSAIFKLSVNKKMPPNPRDSMTDGEILIFSEWIESLEQTAP